MTVTQHSEDCVYSGQAERCDGACTHPEPKDRP